MPEDSNMKKLMGLEPSSYMKITYVLCLIAIGISLIFTLMPSPSVPEFSPGNISINVDDETININGQDIDANDMESYMQGQYASTGAFSGLGTLAFLAGFIGWVMALIGWLKFHDELGNVGMTHARFIGVLGPAFFILGMVLMPFIASVGFLSKIFSILLVLAHGGLLFLGFRAWQNNAAVSKEALLAEFTAVKVKVSNNSNQS